MKKSNQKSDSNVPAPFGTPIQKKRHGKKRSKKNPSEVASTPAESQFKQKSTNAQLPVIPKQQHRPRHLETVEQPKLSQLHQSSGLKSTGERTPTKQKLKEKFEKPHEKLQPPSSSGIKLSSKNGKRVVRTSKSGEKLFQQSNSKSGSKSGEQNLDSVELFINKISPQNIQQSCGKKNNLSKSLEKKKKDGISEEKRKKQKEHPQKSSEPKSSDKVIQKNMKQ